MPSAVVLYFNENTEQIIFNLWDSLKQEGITLDYSADIRPHITLGIFDELPCEPCENELAEFTNHSTNLPLTFSHIGYFYKPEVVLFLAPTPTKELLEYHVRIHTLLANSSKNPWDFYLPGKWVPHCTLILNIQSDQFAKALNICSQLQLPITVNTTQIGVVEFQPMNGVFK